MPPPPTLRIRGAATIVLLLLAVALGLTNSSTALPAPRQPVAASAVDKAVAAAPRELDNPRQEFLRNSVGGLFLHGGLRTAPARTDCTAWENDVTNGGWTPDYWVREAQKLHTQ